MKKDGLPSLKRKQKRFGGFPWARSGVFGRIAQCDRGDQLQLGIAGISADLFVGLFGIADPQSP